MSTTRIVCAFAASLLAASVGGCYEVDRPRAADTNTNWLTCQSDADCRDGARCIDMRCTCVGGPGECTDPSVRSASAAPRPLSAEARQSTADAAVPVDDASAPVPSDALASDAGDASSSSEPGDAGSSTGQGSTLEAVVFEFTGAPQTWTVPEGVTSILVDASGAQGGGIGVIVGPPSNPGFPGGRGARVRTVIEVTPGESLQVFVGGAGGNITFPNTGGPGGWNGGGVGGTDNVDFKDPAGGGGGASDVRRGGGELEDRVVVAGGGGGSQHAAMQQAATPVA